jgi:hypothetical protein
MQFHVSGATVVSIVFGGESPADKKPLIVTNSGRERLALAEHCRSHTVVWDSSSANCSVIDEVESTTANS